MLEMHVRVLSLWLFHGETSRETNDGPTQVMAWGCSGMGLALSIPPLLRFEVLHADIAEDRSLLTPVSPGNTDAG